VSKPRRVADYAALPPRIELAVRRVDTGQTVRLYLDPLVLWRALVDLGFTVVPLDDAPPLDPADRPPESEDG
jgi:hypothetical protein